MPNYKNKETGEVKSFPRIRIVHPDKGESYIVNLDDKNMDMTQWEWFDDNPTTSYETIRMSKSRTDGHGIR
jgi:hypothetical protein